MEFSYPGFISLSFISTRVHFLRASSRASRRARSRASRRARRDASVAGPKASCRHSKNPSQMWTKLRIFTHFGFLSLLFTPIFCLLVLMPNCGLANARMPRARRANDARMRFRPQQICSCPLQNSGNCLFFSCLTDPAAIKHLFLWGLPQTPLVQS